jgi:aminobenzoyl-glutamate utilization protein B
MVNMMREHVPQETRIHYVITDGGDAPNVVPASAEVYYYVRNPEQRVVAEIAERVKRAAEGAALGTGTTVEFEQVGGTFDNLPNDALGQVMHRNLMKVELPTYTAEEQEFIQQISATFPEALRAKGTAVPPYASGMLIPASSDVGDVSYTTPTVGMGAATWAPGTPPHSWQAVAASGHSIGIKGAVVASKALALTAAELFQSPDVLAAAKAELEERRGANFVYRSLLGDQPPALSYRRAGSAD